jgi:hypothetical protein
LYILEAEKTRRSRQCSYLEDYWVQPSVTKLTTALFSSVGRVKITLYKFHPDHDWAIFQRTDGVFDDSEIAIIDKSVDINTHMVSHPAIVLHCPVSLIFNMRRLAEYSIGCNISNVLIQSQSTHHLKYNSMDLVQGSSGGGVFLARSNLLIGLHTEVMTDAEAFEELEDARSIVTTKRVDSEDASYPPLPVDYQPPKKSKKNESDSVVSAQVKGTGLGSGIIICKFPKLMNCIRQCEGEML